MNTKNGIPTRVDKILTGYTWVVHIVDCSRIYNCYLFQFSEYILKYEIRSSQNNFTR